MFEPPGIISVLWFKSPGSVAAAHLLFIVTFFFKNGNLLKRMKSVGINPATSLCGLSVAIV
jgi:hypothetical protein